MANRGINGPLESLSYEDQLKWLGEQVEALKFTEPEYLSPALRTDLRMLLSLAESVKSAREAHQSIKEA